MKIEAPANANYAATVTRLPSLKPLEGCDNLLGAPLFGFQAIISKDHQAGELGIVFPAECQLADEFCSQNNLYRHAEKNKDADAKGYLEDNRRVRAIKLRGHRSDCLWLPLESIAYTGAPIHELTEGDTFDRLGDHEICRKYVIRTREPRAGQPKQPKKFERVDPRLFPEHLDTENYWRNRHLIPEDAYVYVTQKLHGTSVRLGRTLVLRKLGLRERIARRLGVKVQEQEWEAVAGSRKVIKDPHADVIYNHFYSSDIWGEWLARVEGQIPEGFLVFGEIVGYTKDGGAIQGDYHYDMAPGTSALFVYRVATVNPRGVVTDLSWPQVREWCERSGFDWVPDLWEGTHAEFDPDSWLEKRYQDEGFANALPLGSNKKLVDEGVVIRVDGLSPRFWKLKSPTFLGWETKQLDKGEADIESAQTEDVA